MFKLLVSLFLLASASFGYIHIDNPVSGLRYTPDQQLTITWSSDLPAGSMISLFYSLNNPAYTSAGRDWIDWYAVQQGQCTINLSRIVMGDSHVVWFTLEGETWGNTSSVSIIIDDPTKIEKSQVIPMGQAPKGKTYTISGREVKTLRANTIYLEKVGKNYRKIIIK